MKRRFIKIISLLLIMVLLMNNIGELGYFLAEEINVMMPQEETDTTLWLNDDVHGSDETLDYDDPSVVFPDEDDSDDSIDEGDDLNDDPDTEQEQDSTSDEDYSTSSSLIIDGDGDENAPFIIDSIEAFYLIAQAIDNDEKIKGIPARFAVYELKQNIDLSEDASFLGVGTSINKFGGVFNGGTNTIIFNVIATSQSNIGLFRYTEGAEIKNVNLTGTLRGSGNVGPLVGNAINTKVENCTSSVAITASLDNIGGLIGYGQYIQIANSSNIGNLSGRSYVGGLIGRMENATISNSENNGNVSGSSSYAGGIAGGSVNSVIKSCTNNGNVNGNNYASGITGLFTSSAFTSQGLIEDCLVLGNVTAAYSGAGIVGLNSISSNGGLTIRDTHFNGNTITNTNGTSNVFIYSPTSNLLIEGSYFHIKGVISPDGFLAAINGVQCDESLISRSTNGAYSIAVPVSKASGGTIINNAPESVSFFKDGYQTETIFLSENNAKIRYNLLINLDLSPSGVNIAGSGTADAPFIIDNIDELLFITSAMQIGGMIKGVPAISASYRLGADIDISNRANFLGIGLSTHRFSGSFDGAGHTVTVGISSTVESNVGFFRYASGATIKNLTLAGSVHGVSNVGGLVGNAEAGTVIDGINGHATITGSSNNLGGIVGLIENSNIENSKVYSDINNSNRSNIGGIAGSLTNSRIINSKILGNVTGNNQTGSIVGYATNPIIINCETWGNVTGGSIAGGIAGYIASGGSISDCLIYGNVTGGNNSGGVVGFISDSNVSMLIEDTYFVGTQINQSTSNVFIGSAGSRLIIQDSGYYIVGSVIPNTAEIAINDMSYDETLVKRSSDDSFSVLIPVSKVSGNTTVVNNQIESISFMESGYRVKKIFLSENNAKQRYNLNVGNITLEIDLIEGSIQGSGTASSPFMIENEEQLQFIAETISIDGKIKDIPASTAYYLQDADLDMSTKPGFLGIGSTNNPFKGVFDGNGYAVQLNINNTTEDNIGLFRHTQSALIRNITTNGSVRGRNNVGALIGSAGDNTLIEDSMNQATVTGTNNIGGIVGYLTDHARIENAISKGNINGSSYIGGVVGYALNNSIIMGCEVNIGVTITGNLSYIGGVVGRAENTYIENCMVYNDITNSGRSYVSGIVGYAINPKIISCEIWGNVTGNSITGGIAGAIASGGYVSDCTVYGNITGGSSSGGVVGTFSNSTTVGMSIINTYFKGAQINQSTSNVFVGSAGNNLIIQDSGYFVYGSVFPNTARVAINDILHDESLIERNSDNSFSVLIPVSKESGNSTIINNQIESISFMESGHKIIKVLLSANNAKQRYNFDVGIITLEVDLIEESINGNGTVASPFIIENEEQLQFIAETIAIDGKIKDISASTAYYLQDTDLNMSTKPSFLGIGSTNNPFRGVFDGNGYAVQLNINNATEDNIGLFRYTQSASIRNITTKGSVRGRNNVGALVGSAGDNTLIEDSINQATVTGTSNIGGIVGYALNNSIIMGCEVNVGVTITGSSSYIGGVVGRAENTNIENCKVYNDITNSNRSYVSGIVGFATNSNIINCEIWGNVTGSSNTGGIAGAIASGGYVSDCTVYGNITGGNSSGGIAGEIASGGYVSDCTVYGNITGGNNTGGIAGMIASGGYVSDCTVYGNITGGISIGGVVGTFSNSTTVGMSIINTYFKGTQINQSSSNVFVGSAGNNLIIQDSGYYIIGSLVPHTAEISINDMSHDENLIERKSDSSFSVLIPVSKVGSNSIINNQIESISFIESDYKIKKVFLSENNAKRNYKLDIGNIVLESSGAESIIKGEGTAALPFLIENTEQLLSMRDVIDVGSKISGVTASEAHYKVTAHLNLSTQSDFLGIGTATHPFKGVFDGNSQTIMLNINQEAQDNVGLFRHTQNAMITNVTIDGSVNGRNNVGALVGSAGAGTVIQNTENKATVNGTSYIGGIVGNAGAGTVIQNTENKATVNGTNNIGGIVGNAVDTTITNSKTLANINGGNFTGGIAGTLSSSLSTTQSLIENCLVTGNLTLGLTTANTGGGIVGRTTFITGTGSIIIRDTYYQGSRILSALNSQVFIGTTANAVVIENSGFYISGTLVPPNAAVSIDGESVPEQNINRTGSGSFTALIPVTKSVGGTVLNNIPGTLSFFLGNETKDQPLSLRNEKRDYNFNLGQIVVFEDADHHANNNASISQILSPSGAHLQNTTRLITVSVENEVDTITIDIKPTGNATWKLFSDPACTKEITNPRIDLPVGNTTVYILVTSANGQTRRVYTFIATRNPVRPRIITGLTTLFREQEVQLTWDMAYEANVTRYNIYRSTSPNSGFSRIATVMRRDNLVYTDRTVLYEREYFYKVSAINSEGAESYLSTAVLGMALNDTTPPVIMSFTPPNNQTIGKTTSLTVRADDNRNLQSIRLEYLDNGGQWILMHNINASGITNTRTFNLNNLPISGAVTVRAIATDSSGNISTPEERTYILKTQPLPKVTGVNGTSNAGNIRLYWYDVDDDYFDHFQVEQKDTITGTFRKIANVNNTLGYIVSGLQPNQTYWFRVRAVDIFGNLGEYSDELAVSTTVDATPPIITNLRPTPNFYNASIPVVVTATDNIAVEHVLVELSTDKTNWMPAESTNINPPMASVTTTINVSISHLPEGSIYVRASATDTSGNNSQTSPIVEHRILRTPPNPPSGVTTENSATSIRINWAQSTEQTIKSFRVYRTESVSEPFILLANNVRTIGYIDNTAQSNKTYYYKVTAVDAADNESDFSATVSGQILPDTDPPVIRDTLPREGEIVGQNPRIRVLAGDNLALLSVTADYKCPETGIWQTIGTNSVTGSTAITDFTWKNGTIPNGLIALRFHAIDQAGNKGEYRTVNYELKKLVDSPVLKATPGAMRMELTLSIIQNNPDMIGYKLYRLEPNGSSTLLGTYPHDPAKPPKHTDHYLNPYREYAYYAEAYDKYGNIAFSETVRAYPENKDLYLPTANAGTDSIAVVGVETAFSAMDSFDNVGIVSYKWEFQDNTTLYGERVTRVFESEGSQTVKLTVSDAAGNTDTTTITVDVKLPSQAGTYVLTVQDVNQKPLANAWVYANFEKEYRGRTDQNGRITLSAKPGKYQVSAYATDYLPREITIDINLESSKGTITLTHGELVTGTITHKRLTLQQIEDLGIDTSNPANNHVYSFDIALEFHGFPVVQNIIVGGNGTLYGGWGWGGGIWGSFPVPGGIVYPQVVPIPDHPELEPIIAFLYVGGSVSFLKDFFEVKLILENKADEQFVLTNNTATLNLPKGLSIVDTISNGDYATSAKATVDDIAGGYSQAAAWIVRGDDPGSYHFSADFEGSLQPFNAGVNATFGTTEPMVVRGTEGLTLFFYPKTTAKDGEPYQMRFGLANNSGREYNLINVSFGSGISESIVRETGADTADMPILSDGQGITVRTLGPGERLNGIYETTFEGVPSEVELLYILKNVYVRSDIPVVVVWDGDTTYIDPTDPAWTAFFNRFKPGLGEIDPDEEDQCDLDPVDMVSGNFLWDYTDFELYGGQKLSFTRHYNSIDNNHTTIGYGWRHSFDYHLRFDTKGAHVTVPNGFIYNFSPQSFIPITSLKTSLTQNGSQYIFTLYDETRITFTDDGRPISIADRHGNTTTLSYSGNHLTTAENKAGRFNFTYDNDRITAITDNTQREVRYEYDEHGNLTQYTNPDGDTLRYTYDNRHNILEITDFNGKTYLTNTYDSFGRVTAQYLADQGWSYVQYDIDNAVNIATSPNGEKNFYYYDDKNKLTHVVTPYGTKSQDFDTHLKSTTDYMGKTRTFTYDNAGNRQTTTHADNTTDQYEYNSLRQVTKHTARDSSTTHYTYDDKGNLTSVTDPLTGTVRYTYDENNNMLTHTDATGATIHYTYDAKGNRTSVKNAVGQTTTYEYDSLGRLVAETAPGGERTKYEYTAAGKLTKIIHPEPNSTTTYEVNGNGYNTAITDPMGFTTTTQYDGMNNPTAATDPEGGKVTYQYDNNGNMIQQTDAMGFVTQYAYDYKGRLLYTIDPNGNTWRYEYNANGQLTKTTDPLNNPTSLTYDENGRLTRTTNARNAQTSFTYNNMGRLTQQTNAEKGQTSYHYDNNGNVIRQTDPNGNLWEFKYDKANRLIQSIDPLKGETKYEYDAIGRLTRITTPGGASNQSTYDISGRLAASTDPLGGTTEYEYDIMGKLIKRTNPDNKTHITFIYDKNGRVLSTTDESGNTTAYTYDRNGNALTITDALSHLTQYAYDKNNRLTSVSDPSGGKTTYSYDKSGNILSVVDPTSGRTSYTYNALNQVSTVTDPMGNTTAYTYDAVGNIISLKDAENNTTRFTYDLLDRLTSHTDSEGHTAKTTYDPNGNVIQYTDARNHSTTYEYDPLNRMTKTIDPENGYVQYYYDPDGNVISVIDQNGASTTYTYDPKGRVVSVEMSALNIKTQFEYDTMDRVIQSIDANGAKTQYTYTPTGQLSTVTDAFNGTTTFTYDALDRLLSETNPMGEENTYTYDPLGRVMAITDPLGNKETFAYDANGRILSVTNKNGQTTQYVYDPNGNVIETLDPENGKSMFTYDKMNRLTSATLANNGVTLYEYDGRGLVTRTVNALGDLKAFVYDQNGNLISQTDEDGYTTAYAYNAWDLVASISYEGGKKVSYRYDKTGRLIGLEDWTGKTSFTLDAMGKVLMVNDQNNRVTTYEYDKSGNQTTIGYPDGEKVSYTYDALNRLTAIKEGSNTTSYEYDAASRPIKLTYPNGIVEHYTYDKGGRLMQVTEGARPVRQYTYDAAGNALTDSGATGDKYKRDEAYIESVYNRFNQLTERVVFDANGYVQAHVEYGYDKRGNLVKEIDLVNYNAIKSYDYDATNCMVKATNANGEVSAYTYNGLGVRTSHTATTQAAGTVKTDYVIDYTSAAQLELASFGSNGIDTRYTYGTWLNKVSATVTNRHTGDKTRLNIQTDRLGSGRQATDATGQVVAHTMYNEWGMVLEKAMPTVGGVQIDVIGNFTNHEPDPVFENLFYAKARFYDPNTMRFMAADPHWNANNRIYGDSPTSTGGALLPDINAIRQSTNLYAYVMNNPINFIDPLGLARIVVSGGNHGTEGFKYNFIETAILHIRLWQEESNERITWAIASHYYTKEDIDNFLTVGESLGVRMLIFDNKDQYFNYLSCGLGEGDRAANPITNMVFFAHGTFLTYQNQQHMAIALGMSNIGVSNHNFNIFAFDLDRIYSSSFATVSHTRFYSCRTGLTDKGVNLAQEWANATGSITIAADVRTDFTHIFPDDRRQPKRFLANRGIGNSRAEREIEREEYGFSTQGSRNLPELSYTGGPFSSWKIFLKPEDPCMFCFLQIRVQTTAPAAIRIATLRTCEACGRSWWD